MRDNAFHADYNTTTNSWIEQRTYITNAPALLAKCVRRGLGMSVGVRVRCRGRVWVCVYVWMHTYHIEGEICGSWLSILRAWLRLSVR